MSASANAPDANNGPAGLSCLPLRQSSTNSTPLNISFMLFSSFLPDRYRKRPALVKIFPQFLTAWKGQIAPDDQKPARLEGRQPGCPFIHLGANGQPSEVSEVTQGRLNSAALARYRTGAPRPARNAGFSNSDIGFREHPGSEERTCRTLLPTLAPKLD
jgi:hypothetical protein